ncbi:hypothetical protein ONZ45_g16968 [Pleurotus djamor]|nr:hypothetical protein ONZ45_g16968 [Pleurotus djamor]
MSDRKRAFEGTVDASNKKPKSDSTSNGLGAAKSLIEQKRAEIAAKMAAMKNKMAASTPSLAAPIPSKPAVAAPGLAIPTPPSGTSTPGTPGTPLAGVSDDLARRVAEAKRRVAEAQTKVAVKSNPYMSTTQVKKAKPTEPAQQGAGLKMAAHPLLLDTTPVAPQSKKDRYKPMQPKFASIKANERNQPTPPPPPPSIPIVDTSNPYTSAPVKDTGFDGAPKERMGRSFRFNSKGKYVQLANQMRQEQQLEALKQRIAESARKAGLDSEFDTLEKNIRRLPPPEAEWWDETLLPGGSYNDLAYGFSYLYIHTDDSPITLYIQHPIPIPAPGDKNKIALKPLMLTSKEQKKMRKRRRAAELQDKRDRIRMGLIPPDPPKVRIANIMKVLTSDAVQDPTRVEARVRREVAMRKHGHEKMNSERKLTDDQRREKIENKKVEQEKKGIYGAVFKIKTLAHPLHRIKVKKNAEQMNLTGVCIFNPAFSMVYVEGAAKFIKSYKRLMLHRIAWTEAPRPRGGEEVELDEDESAEGQPDKGKEKSIEDEPDSISYEENKCWLVWEGQLRDRSFNTFRPKSCPTDGSAREVLGDKLKGYWDQAKNWKPEEEELF